MKISLGTRLVGFTALLVVGTVALIVWQWASTESARMYVEKRDDATATARSMAGLMVNAIDDQNWSSIRLDLNLVVDAQPDVAYALVHARSQDGRIVSSQPPEFGDRNDFYPDVVPLTVSRDALASDGVVVAETVLLRDVVMASGRSSSRGERVLEVAAPIRIASGTKIGTLRLALSIEQIDREVRAAIWSAVSIGVVVLLIALAGAWIVARRLVRPIEKLAVDAKRIAAGDLGHRADIVRGDELGALATAFNNMSFDLAASFGKLRATNESFQRFVPQKFLAVVAPEGMEKIKIGTAAPRKIAVLFSDIRGFTKMSEQMTPAQVFDLLNVYLARMGDAIDQAGGFVDKYIGDAIMALFDDEHTDGLLRAIVGMRHALVELNAERAARGEPPIETGIGAHGGNVVMGTIGFASKIESTVIGDPVNVASRVEGMTKDHHVAVLITGDIVARISDRAAFPLRLIAEKVAVRGRVDPIDLYTLDV